LPSEEVDIKFHIPNIFFFFAFLLTISVFLEFEHTKFGCILYIVERRKKWLQQKIITLLLKLCPNTLLSKNLIYIGRW